MLKYDNNRGGDKMVKRKQFSISMNDAEREIALKKAKMLGFSLSSYIRSLIMRDNIKE